MLAFSAIYNNTGIHRQSLTEENIITVFMLGVSFLKLKEHRSIQGLFTIFSAFDMREFSAVKSRFFCLVAGISGSPVLPSICKIQLSGTVYHHEPFFSLQFFYLPVVLVFSAIYNNTR
jgi:hypothetical protein